MSPYTTSPPDGSAFPEELGKLEDGLIAERRKQSKDPKEQGNQTKDLAIGLAISGGGIRSATFALGFLQALSGLSLLRKFDYLSTVSGGGYIGGFLGSLFISQEAREARGAQAKATDYWARASKALELGSDELSWLRNNGRYLSPNGAGDDWLDAAFLLRNWATVQAVFAIFFSSIFAATNLLRAILLAHGATRVANGWAVSPIWWSPLIAIPGILLLLWVIPAATAYWLVPSGREGRWSWEVSLTLLVLSVCAVLTAINWPPDLFGNLTARVHAIPFVVGVLAALTLCFRLPLGRCSTLHDEERGRNVLSNVLKVGLLLTAATAAFGLIDSFGQTLYALFKAGPQSAWIPAVGFAGTAAIGKKLATFVAGDQPSASAGLSKMPLAPVALLVAGLIYTACLSILSAVSQAVAWKLQLPGPVALMYGLDPKSAGTMSVPSCAWMLAATLAVSFFLGRAFTFINQSSLASLYAARLTRAYLGASNARRHPSTAGQGEGTNQNVTEVVEGDDIPFAAYKPHANGGPLHLINATLNETVDGRSQLEQRDRKGMSFALGPAGVSVGVQHHALWDDAREKLSSAHQPAFTVFQGRGEVAGKDFPLTPESLPLGKWIAISGAAVATGLGSRTSVGFSLLCGFFNLRLGHWWDSDTEPGNRPRASHLKTMAWIERALSNAFPVQLHLLDEFLARFHGTSRRNWYLTDGGHFDNTGCYELIRRRVPFIVFIDNGADQKYRFDDFSQLVRLARLDFAANIRILSTAELSIVAEDGRKYLGTLADIWGRTSLGRDVQWNERCAALATVTYGKESAPGSIILIIKPTLTGDEPQDLRQYALADGVFPQQSTGDQFFDEAQWESYRRLGEHIGNRVFGPLHDNSPKWRPRSLDATVFVAPVANGRA